MEDGYQEPWSGAGGSLENNGGYQDGESEVVPESAKMLRL